MKQRPLQRRRPRITILPADPEFGRSLDEVAARARHLEEHYGELAETHPGEWVAAVGMNEFLFAGTLEELVAAVRREGQHPAGTPIRRLELNPIPLLL